jgi:hypothetical protein
MNKEAQQKLNAILSKDISSVTQNDKIFLKARSDYLTTQQKELYLSEHKPQEINTTAPSYKDLFAIAKAKGLKVRVGIRKEDLMRLVGQH